MTTHRVRDIMRTEMVTLTAETPIRRAVALLVEHRAAAAPVTADHGRLDGLLTQKDCFRPALNAGYYQEWKGTVGDHMTRDVVTVAAEDEVMSAAEMFLAHPHRLFPVLDDARLAGILHRADVLAFLSREG
ncbi:CBS domain-containing protein [Rhodobacterales bacterium HKCCE2091]|nr:CBS domain-containing protein [Rhodobacterales bacterium HKCCE2091]